VVKYDRKQLQEHGAFRQFGGAFQVVESAPMTSLYDVLGARADDDRQALTSAFRKAVKASHPDLHPNSPEAVLRFRQIINAAAVLRDAQRRAAYDQLLDAERQQIKLRLDQQRQRLRHQRRRRSIRVAAAVVCVLTLIGGYRLLMPFTQATRLQNQCTANMCSALAMGPAATDGRLTTLRPSAGDDLPDSAPSGLHPSVSTDLQDSAPSGLHPSVSADLQDSAPSGLRPSASDDLLDSAPPSDAPRSDNWAIRDYPTESIDYADHWGSGGYCGLRKPIDEVVRADAASRLIEAEKLGPVSPIWNLRFL
jgi:DnaJ domain